MKSNHHTTSLWVSKALLALSLFLQTPLFAGENLADGFRFPPDATKPWCYWYWISDNLSKEGISRDLEAMARVGLGEAFIGNIFLDSIAAGEVKVLSEPWWELVEHAIREADRVGVNIGMFNCPGWSQSGGPWIAPEQAMRYLVSSETRLHGPMHFAQKLPVPAEPFQDVGVIAFPVTQEDEDSLTSHSPRVACLPVADKGELAVDGKLETALVFPDRAGSGNRKFQIDIQLREPLTVRHLALVPSESPWAAQCELFAAGDDGKYATVRRFRFDRSNMGVTVGPMPRGPVMISFPPVSASHFRLVFSHMTGQGALAEIDLSAAPRLESYVEKQLGKMHPTPLPQWDTYLWPNQPELDQPALAVAPTKTIDLTARLMPDGMLQWDVPPGDWVVLRTGMTTTGTRNAPAAPEGQGLEVDKMNRAAIKHHFDAFMGEIFSRMPASQRKALKHVVADSYEMGSQNWTDGFAVTFRDRYGYDPLPWLPVLTGRIVGSANLSDRFLWDLRRLVADRIAIDYVGGLRDLCRPHGLQLWLENYGHWGFPGEFLQYGGQSDLVGGEFWTQGDLGSIECRAASSAANIYGKPFVSAEAFTSTPSRFDTMPADLKARGDWCFCEGINHLVLHVCVHQPWEDRKPGLNTPFGTEFNRHNTWFEESKSWIDYLRRCCYLLQQGTRVADVAYFIGEDTPKMSGSREPELPAGHDFDYINAEVILQRLSVQDGRLVLPHGANYRVLVLPELETMRPELLRKIGDLIQAGATVVGRPPTRSPSMENYPQCDALVAQLANEIWGEEASQPAGSHRLGLGQIIWGQDLVTVFAGLDIPPDFVSQTPLRYTHRSEGSHQIYFVANPLPQEVETLATFRVGNRAPQLWWPDSGKIVQPAVYNQSGENVRLPLTLGPHGSVFIVFTDEPAAADRIVLVARGAETILDANPTMVSPPRATKQKIPTSNAMESADTHGDVQSVQLTMDHTGLMMGEFWRPGDYSLINAAGQSKTIKVRDVPTPLVVAGPWQVTFQAPGAKPRETVFTSLSDWSKHADRSIRHFSGRATYHAAFTLPDFHAGRRFRLDLGDVGGLATLRVNGRDLGTIWIEPWQVDITPAVQPGANTLEIDVVNPWHNRLVGDAQLTPVKRQSFLTLQTVSSNLPLQPAGLMGPVTIQVAESIELRIDR